MTKAKYANLKRTIAKVGFLQPLLVRSHPKKGDGHFEVVDGAHRLKAAKELGFKEIPCIVREGTNEELAGAIQVGMNNNRGELDLGLVSAAIVDLSTEGWSIEDLSITGYDEEEIKDLLKMADVSTEGVLVNADVPPPPPPDEAPPGGPFVLEIPFATKAERDKVRRALRRSAGKGESLATGALRLIDG
jgi:ParB-like chromosome segregation protein Spo0J